MIRGGPAAGVKVPWGCRPRDCQSAVASETDRIEFGPAELEQARRSLEIIGRQWEQALGKLKASIESQALSRAP